MIFDIQPTVRGEIIDLNINQQLSVFINTTTGVNNSQTLTKRELKTTAWMQDGNVIVLGDLSENKDTQSRDSPTFLARFLYSRGHKQTSSEILLVPQVKKFLKNYNCYASTIYQSTYSDKAKWENHAPMIYTSDYKHPTLQLWTRPLSAAMKSSI